MPKRMMDFYDVTVRFTVMKRYWLAEYPKMTGEIVKDKVQQGIEIPIEDIDVRVVD